MAHASQRHSLVTERASVLTRIKGHAVSAVMYGLSYVLMWCFPCAHQKYGLNGTQFKPSDLIVRCENETCSCVSET